MKKLLLVCIGSFFGGGVRYLRGAIFSLILVFACTASFAQQTGTGAKGKVADSESLAAWYEKTLQLGGITVTGRAADKKVTVEKTSINPVYTLVNNSRSRIFWLGISWNLHSYKPVGGAKKQEEDRSVIKLGE